MGLGLAVPPVPGRSRLDSGRLRLLVRPKGAACGHQPPGRRGSPGFVPGATVRVVATLPDGVEVSSTLPAGEGFLATSGLPS